MNAHHTMNAKKASTMKLSGNDYAKVAERMRLFREENSKGKHESAYEVDVDQTVVFTVWLWKDKTDLLDLMKAGITDKETLRSSSDANGNAKGSIGVKAKDFEKLETIALGRALANLGYLASGEIASSEEMENFNAYREEKINDAITSLKNTATIDELKKTFISLGSLMSEARIIKAKDERKKELTDARA